MIYEAKILFPSLRKGLQRGAGQSVMERETEIDRERKPDTEAEKIERKKVIYKVKIISHTTKKDSREGLG